jgi:hypothetical protein
VCLELRAVHRPWKVSAYEMATIEPVYPDSDLRLPASVIAECVHQFLVDYFCVSSFDREIFDEKSLVQPGDVSIVILSACRIEKGISYSMMLFPEICYRSFS